MVKHFEKWLLGLDIAEKRHEKILLNEFWNLKSAQYMKGFYFILFYFKT